MRCSTFSRVLALAAVAIFALAVSARAATIFQGGNLNVAASWDNGVPSSSNPGTIAVDGSNGSTVFNFGSGSVVDQTGGIITSGDGFNMTNGTWNLSGGAVLPRYFLSNGGSTLINVNGGLVELKDVGGTQHMGVANGGTMNISGTAVLDGTQATTVVQTGGSIDFKPDWTGSWTYGTHSGTDWKDLLTTNSAMKLDGASIDGATFDSTFSVTPDGMTLSMPGGSTPPPPASAIAQFDLNDAGTSPNQTGFESLNADLLTGSATHNGITLTFAGNANGFGRDRGTGGNVGGSPVPNVTRDFTFNDDGRGFATPYFTVSLDGLQPDTEYDLRWHHFENGGAGSLNRLALYQDSAIPANLLFETSSYGSDTTNYFTDFSATSDGLGGLTLVTGPHSGGRSIQMLNGFEVVATQAVPEPSTFALAALGLLGLGWFGQRRKRTA
ncbi:MAG: PEP-CTERM sorting domain-containing protein [Planctomycetes bacterium]|nr:PEP-CTERM sorting domain-containing protein [Planctomycetota bacterium]